MAIEHLIKRTVFVAQCKCGEKDTRDDHAPRERLCSCGKWVPFIEESYTGPDFNQEKRQ